MTGLSIELVDIARLFCSPSNPRHNDAAVPHVADSIRRFGWQQPIVARPSGEVIAGNTRLKAAQRLGQAKVPVVWFTGSDLEATAFAIADNRTHEFATWDEPALAKLLQELRAEDALEGVGFATEDIDALIASIENAGNGAPVEVDDPGPEAPPKNPVSRPGDLWHLGHNRLLCGDSTKSEDVERVMAGAKAVLVATDPPYLVDYTGERPNGTGKDWSATYREVDIKNAEVFFRAVFTLILLVLAPKGAIYCWHAHKRQSTIARIWADLRILDHQQIVWVKPTPVFGRVYWHFRHEPCLMGWRQGEKPEHDGNHEFDSVWEVDWEGKQRIVGNEHPTQKPVELFRRPMRKHTRHGDICFEPFSGSGSQLIAAEQLGRRCYAIEIEPAFVDVAIQRWQAATGKAATLEGGGTFAEIATQRGISATKTPPGQGEVMG
ncbi:MAG: DNA modification methylase [Planctomycetota bacterium]